METSFKTSKRPTAYNVFCSERLKENRHARFQSEDWGKQWRSLSEDEKKYYEDIAFTLRNKSLDVNALLKKIKNITTVLRENQEEVRKAAGIESMCTLVYKDGSLSCTGFGCLGNLLSDRRTYQKLMEFANIASSNSVKESIKELREKVAFENVQNCKISTGADPVSL
ncbi:uncharacterized protein LOC112576309 [Pomacea canaliculata]|uniref:uncharacterized protein LOC112576309 n=1 Tax=Pomacea canaliculata TaxID=400727 RepID=UPI000D73C0FB|nr:uncharacterized protein LOC112576309 [Pomacea canaliculata]